MTSAELESLTDIAICYLHPTSENPRPHLFVLRPLSSGRVQILDYPNSPFVVGKADLAKMGNAWQGDMLIVANESGLAFKYGIRTRQLVTGLIAACGLSYGTVALRRCRRNRRLHQLFWGGCIVVLSCAPAAMVFAGPLLRNDPHAEVQVPQQLLDVIPAVIDLGEVREPGIYRSTVTLRNRSDEPIRLLRSKSSCYCVVAKLPSNPIVPGTSADIQVELKIDRPMRYVQYVYFFTDNEKQQMASVKLMARAESLARKLTPTSLKAN